MKKYILISLIVIVIISCTDQENSVKLNLNHKIQSANNKYVPLNFKLLNYDHQSNKVDILIECDFNKIDSFNYLSQLNKIESILYKEGIKQIKYQIVNKPKNNYIIKNKSILTPKINVNNKIDNSIPLLKNNAIVNYNFVRLRESPTTKSHIISYLFNGTIVKIMDNNNKLKIVADNKNYWYLIKTKDNKQGWIFGHYLSQTSKKLISSSLNNNKIYKDFLKKKKLLIPAKYNIHTNKPMDNIQINSNNIVINIKKKKNFKIPFQIVNEEVKWKINASSLLPDKLISYDSPMTIEKNIANNKIKRVSNKQIIPIETIDKDSSIKTTKNLVGNINIEGINKDDSINTYYSKSKEISHKSISNKHIKPNKYYNLKININPYFKSKATPTVLNKIKAIMKIVEARLILKDYKRDINFYSKFNPVNDTVKIIVNSINFDNKKMTIYIKRVNKDFQKDIANDMWLINFEGINKLKQKLNFKEMSEAYYTEILIALSYIHPSKRKEIIGLANYIVDNITKQKYL